MDIINLITEVSFPIFISAYLLYLVTKKMDNISRSLDLLLIYLGILLSEHGFNLRDTEFSACVQLALEQKAKKEK